MENLICTIFQWKNRNSITDLLIIHNKNYIKNNKLVLKAIVTSIR